MIACLLVPTTVMGQQTGSLGPGLPVFSGVAYLAPLSDAARLFPYAWAIDSLARQRGSTLDQLFFHALEANGITLSRDLAPRPGVAIALAFDEESTSRDEIAGHARLLVTVGAQLIAYDFKEQRALTAFPISVERVEVVPARASADFDNSVRDTLYRLVAGEAGGSMLALAARAYSRLRARDALPCRLQVGVGPLDSSVTRLANARFPGDSNAMGRRLRTMFERTWITVTNYPLLPSAPTHAVNGQMAGQFADGRIFNLTVPDPDYVINLDSATTRRRTVGSTAAERADAVGAYMRFTVVEPETKATVASGRFKDALIDRVPTLQGEVDEMPSASAAFESLFAGFAAAVRDGNLGWFNAHAVSPADVQAGLQFHHWISSQCALVH
jgi:hypothetical protein